MKILMAKVCPEVAECFRLPRTIGIPCDAAQQPPRRQSERQRSSQQASFWRVDAPGQKEHNRALRTEFLQSPTGLSDMTTLL